LVEGKIYKETMVFPSKYRGFPLKMAIFPWDSGIPTVDSLRQALLIRKDDAPAKAAGPKERGKGGRALLRACQPSKNISTITIFNGKTHYKLPFSL